MHKGAQSLTNKMIKRIYGYDVALQHTCMACHALIVQNSNTVFVTPFIEGCYKMLASLNKAPTPKYHDLKDLVEFHPKQMSLLMILYVF